MMRFKSEYGLQSIAVAAHSSPVTAMASRVSPGRALRADIPICNPRCPQPVPPPTLNASNPFVRRLLSKTCDQLVVSVSPIRAGDTSCVAIPLSNSVEKFTSFDSPEAPTTSPLFGASPFETKTFSSLENSSVEKVDSGRQAGAELCPRARRYQAPSETGAAR
jgi:hypothetical protein